MTCPKCKTDRAHQSHRKDWKDYAISLFQRYPYRCCQCGARFFQLRPKPPKTDKPTPVETEIRATRATVERRRRRREFLLYGAALLCFLLVLYFITRDRDTSAASN